ncbi:hypothetical protein BDP27DRAFT_1369407 [Rhodocollybia butyracea]|uniref:Uncharacterized protein n=1 Tax=Rhodocollybia butyracea TaxID=206335 RepID=A0A9P5U1L8_9AGAR|nr:hypothetical protein BDP27DRAFT_1369407 [Rhodocollybia butyracea]
MSMNGKPLSGTVQCWGPLIAAGSLEPAAWYLTGAPVQPRFTDLELEALYTSETPFKDRECCTPPNYVFLKHQDADIYMVAELEFINAAKCTATGAAGESEQSWGCFLFKHRDAQHDPSPGPGLPSGCRLSIILSVTKTKRNHAGKQDKNNINSTGSTERRNPDLNRRPFANNRVWEFMQSECDNPYTICLYDIPNHHSIKTLK